MMADSGRRQCAQQRNASEPDGDSGSKDFPALPSESRSRSGYPLALSAPAARPQGPPFHATIGLFRFRLLLHGSSCSILLAAATSGWLPMLLATPPVARGQCRVSAVTCQWPARASSRAFQISVRTPAVPSAALSSSPGKDEPRRVVSERCQAAAGTSSRTRNTGQPEGSTGSVTPAVPQ